MISPFNKVASSSVVVKKSEDAKLGREDLSPKKDQEVKIKIPKAPDSDTLYKTKSVSVVEIPHRLEHTKESHEPSKERNEPSKERHEPSKEKYEPIKDKQNHSKDKEKEKGSSLLLNASVRKPVEVEPVVEDEHHYEMLRVLQIKEETEEDQKQKSTSNTSMTAEARSWVKVAALIFVIIIVIGLVVGVVVFFTTSGKSKSKSDNSTSQSLSVGTTRIAAIPNIHRTSNDLTSHRFGSKISPPLVGAKSDSPVSTIKPPPSTKRTVVNV